jgi:hypothetical protein
MARAIGLEALVGVSYGYMARDSKVARCRSIGPLGAHISGGVVLVRYDPC